jgi:hypothetical protein
MKQGTLTLLQYAHVGHTPGERLNEFRFRSLISPLYVRK